MAAAGEGCLNAQFSIDLDQNVLCELCLDFGTGELEDVDRSQYIFYLLIIIGQPGI